MMTLTKARLGPRSRKTIVVLHVFSSVGWLGLTLADLVLAVVGLNTTDPRQQHAVYLVLDVFASRLLIPISLTAYVTGLVLSWWTPWGLFKHRWVSIKFWLTSVALLLTLFSLTPGIHDTAALVRSTPPDLMADLGESGPDLLAAACVSGTMYTTCLVLSVFKPRLRRKTRPRPAQSVSSPDRHVIHPKKRSTV